MTQDEKWLAKYNEVKRFIKENQRNPSKYDDSERGLYCNWLRHNKKLYNAGGLKETRMELFRVLLKLGENYKRVNQYQ